jgi:EAL domain-containing protein (putative c-di-GMP-specific phosphodiesterase class I)
MPNDLATALAITFHPLVRAESERAFAWRAEVTGKNGWTIDSVLDILEAAERDALDAYCAALAVTQAVARGLGRTEALLIVPIHAGCETPDTILGHLVATAHRHGISPDRIVIEINADERGDLEAAERLAEACAIEGLAVTLGGFVSGRVGVNLLARFKPRYVRLDRSLVRNIGGSDSRRHIVEGALRLAQSLGTTVVATAPETQDEHDTLRRIGVTHMERGSALRPLPSAVAPRRAPRSMPIAPQRDASTRRTPVGSFAAFESVVHA